MTPAGVHKDTRGYDLTFSKLAPPFATLLLFQILQYQATRLQRHKLQKKSDELGKKIISSLMMHPAQ